MSQETPLERARQNLTGIVSMLVTGLWMAGLFTGQEWWLPALIVGYAVVVPLTATLFGDDADREEWVATEDREATQQRGTRSRDESPDTPLESLRRRYAAGELTDE